ncbi:MAG: 50S ribosomal protein P1 [Thermoplasmata archaeon]
MEYVYTAMLLHSAGKEITEESVEKVLKAAGVKPDPTRVKALTASLEGVDIEEAMSTAFSLPVAAAPGAAAEPVEEKKEGKKKKEEKEVSEEEAAAGLGALFG